MNYKSTSEILSYNISTEKYQARSCAKVPRNIFFPEENNRADQIAAISVAQAICAGCIIQLECRKAADSTGEKFGIWGGKYFQSDSRLYNAIKPNIIEVDP